MNAIASSWPVLFVSALLYHISKLLTFSHDCKKLPAPFGATTLLLLGLHLMLGLLMGLMPGEEGVSALAFTGVWAMTIASALLMLKVVGKLVALPGVVMVMIGTNIVAILAAWILGSFDGIVLPKTIWEIAAMTVVLNRTPKKD